jgi:hypothetical protein
MPLGGPQADDGLGQGRKLEDEPELRDERVAGDDGHGGQRRAAARSLLPAGVGRGRRP